MTGDKPEGGKVSKKAAAKAAAEAEAPPAPVEEAAPVEAAVEAPAPVDEAAPVKVAFVTKFQDKFKQAPNLFSAQAYDAMFILAREIQTGIHYPVASHRQPAVERFAGPAMPETERLVDEILTLPISAGHTEGEIDTVAAAVREFFGA